jgi:hypothetical protein
VHETESVETANMESCFPFDTVANVNQKDSTIGIVPLSHQNWDGTGLADKPHFLITIDAWGWIWLSDMSIKKDEKHWN